MWNWTKAALAAAAVLALCTSSRAATVSNAGIDEGGAPTFRTTTVAKPLDLNGDNRYGSSGYLLFDVKASGGENVGAVNPPTGQNNLFSPPNFATVSISGGVALAGGYGYVDVDDPTSIAAAPPDVNTGLAYLQTNGGPAGPNGLYFGDVVEFTVNAAVPSLFRFGVLTDNSDGSQYSPDQLVLTHITAGFPQAFSPILNENLNGDMVFFDVTGAVAGDRFILAVLGTQNSTKGIGGITFDAVPEPATFGALSFGGLGLLAVAAATQAFEEQTREIALDAGRAQARPASPFGQSRMMRRCPSPNRPRWPR